MTWTILHGGALGDLVLTLQLARRLPGMQAGATLRLVTRVNPGDLTTFRPPVRRFSSEWFGLHWLYGESEGDAPEPLRNLVHRGAIISALAPADSFVHARLLRLGPRALYSFAPQHRPDWNTHITLQWSHDLRKQGLSLSRCVYRAHPSDALRPTPEMRQRGAQILARADTIAGCILIHPGSGSESKNWPLPNFLEVARLLKKADYPVAWLIGEVELERWEPARIEEMTREAPLLRALDPDDLLAVLASVGAFLGNDSGPGHLASLLGAPTVSVFGPTSAEVWGPLGPRTTALQGHPLRSRKRWDIRPEAVRDALIRLISQAD